LEKLGEGAHGVVVRARVRSREQVAQARREARALEEREAQAAEAQAVALQHTPRKRKLVEQQADAAAAAAVEAEEALEDIQLPAPEGTIVAIKKIRLRSAAEGLSIEAVREIKLLPELHHPHVLSLYEIFMHHSNIHLVLEYMTGDLEQLLRSMAAQGRALSPGDVKAYIRMILLGVQHCHQQFIMHRDLKPGNLLIGTDNTLKIADFGLAKIFGSPDRRYSPQACTIWYRAPELLMGASSYGAAADMWSVGCILGEMFWMKPMFAGQENELSQLTRIFAVLGTPTKADWPLADQLKHYIAFKPQAGHPMRTLFPALPEDACDLLAGLLTLNPLKRLTATEALNHRYFTSKPFATPLAQLPSLKAVLEAKHKADQAAAAAAAAARPPGKKLSFD